MLQYFVLKPILSLLNLLIALVTGYNSLVWVIFSCYLKVPSFSRDLMVFGNVRNIIPLLPNIILYSAKKGLVALQPVAQVFDN